MILDQNLKKIFIKYTYFTQDNRGHKSRYDMSYNIQQIEVSDKLYIHEPSAFHSSHINLKSILEVMELNSKHKVLI